MTGEDRTCGWVRLTRKLTYREVSKSMKEGLKLAWITGSSMGVPLGLNGRNSCTSVLPELMGYLSTRVNRVVIYGPECNSAEDKSEIFKLGV